MTSTALTSTDTLPLKESTPLKEKTWVTYIAQLNRYERDVLFSHELDWHDRFVKGELTILDVAVLIQEQLDR